MNIVDSPSGNPKTVVQYPSGHAFLAFSDFFKYPRRQKACPFSLFNQGTHLRDEPKNLPAGNVPYFLNAGKRFGQSITH
jgi:hypothetical protein